MGLALVGARIMTASDGVIEKGTLLIEGRTIEAVGADVQLPTDTDVWDVSGNVLIPGMIDAHTHLGLCQDGVGAGQSDEDEVGDPVVPHLRALDAINPEDIAFQDALKGGSEPETSLKESYEKAVGQLQSNSTYQRLVSAQANFDKVLFKVNRTIQEGIAEGAESRIILP